ncbi:MAG: hypothetical protein KAH23_00435 [Kiritimatiellae bacterium]|nr:hypothetical protein [Kiritimatiellia bacterium]
MKLKLYFVAGVIFVAEIVLSADIVIRKGDTMGRVEEIMGKAQGTLKQAGRDVWVYDRGPVTFKGGKVVAARLLTDKGLAKKKLARKKVLQATKKVVAPIKEPAGEVQKLPQPIAVNNIEWFPAGFTMGTIDKATKDVVGNAKWASYISALSHNMILSYMDDPDSFLSDEVLLKALAQFELVNRLGSVVLVHIANRDAGKSFLEWLLLDLSRMEVFLGTFLQGDSPEKVMDIWLDLWRNDEEGRDKYIKLAVACAVVFDSPIREIMPVSKVSANVDVAKRYNLFREFAEKRQFKVPFEGLTASELVWIVDAPVSDEELRWVRRRTSNEHRGSWGKVYDMVPYRINVLRNNVTEKHVYVAEVKSLLDMLMYGGICSDQAFFASVAAKANGIPAMTIKGERKGIGHAWFGFKQTDDVWDYSSGGNGYFCEEIRHPQDGRILTDYECQLMFALQKETTERRVAKRSIRLTRVMLKDKRAGTALQVIEATLSKSKLHHDVWQMYLFCLEKNNSEDVAFQKAFEDIRACFVAYPHVIADVDRREAERVFKKKGAKAAAHVFANRRKSLQKNYFVRRSLVLRSIELEISYRKKAGEIDDAVKLYEELIVFYANDLTMFKRLSRRYHQFALDFECSDQALNYIDKTFTRFQNKPAAGRTLAGVAYVDMLEMIAGFYERAGKDREAKWRKARARTIKLSL